MNYKALKRNLGVAVIAQGISLLCSFAMSALVPKVLGIEEYGYWQLFIFYSSYVGFFAFGIGDGIYLINGGRTRDEIDKRDVNSQLIVGFAWQVLVAVVISVAALCAVSDHNRQFVLCAVSVYLLFSFVFGALGLLFQAMNETKAYSFSIMIWRLVFLVPMLALILMGGTDFEPFVISYIGAVAFAALLCCWHARDFIRAGFLAPHKAVRSAIASVKVGIKLMVSSIASMLVLGVLRMMIDARWGIETFGQLSLSLSLANFALAFIGQVGMVLFPALRQSDKEELTRAYLVTRDAMALVMPSLYMLSFPAVWLLSWWLPSYAGSLSYLIWLMPICVFDSQMSILVSTYLKVLREERKLLFVNLLAMFTSLVGVSVGIWLFGSFEFAVGAAVFAIVLRSFLGKWLVANRLEVPHDTSLSAGEATLTIVSLVMGTTLPPAAAFVGVAAVYVTYLVVYHRHLTSLRVILGRRS